MNSTGASAALSRTRIDGDRWLDGIDPRARIVATAVFAVAVIALSSLATLGAAVGVAAVAATATRMPLRDMLGKFLAMEGFMVVLLASLPFTVPGTAVLEVGPLAASREGLLLGLAIALKANAVVLMLLSQIGTLDPTRLGHALVRFGLPATLVALLLLTVRYIGVLEDEYHRLRRAMQMRAFRPGTNSHTWRSLGWLMGMLLVRSNDRAHRLLQAMKCRGYTGRFFLIDRLVFGRADLAYGLALIVPMVGLLLWDRL